MKNLYKLFGIIALIAIIGFSMAACDDSNSEETVYILTQVGYPDLDAMDVFFDALNDFDDGLGTELKASINLTGNYSFYGFPAAQFNALNTIVKSGGTAEVTDEEVTRSELISENKGFEDVINDVLRNVNSNGCAVGGMNMGNTIMVLAIRKK